ncbi:hypothetical protein BRD14_03275 [Halobacteriales archaeon SW_5_68_122]|nr:MAG: hypothetical protein BRD14_03275 [Halobacteriales archaeon SW_5_68_122]
MSNPVDEYLRFRIEDDEIAALDWLATASGSCGRPESTSRSRGDATASHSDYCNCLPVRPPAVGRSIR